MGLLTSSQANACTIIKTEKIVRGSDTWWQAIVKDADGACYDMDLKGVGVDPSIADLKSAIMEKLLTLPKKTISLPKESTIINKGIGETIG